MLYHFSELKDLLQRAMSVEVGWPNFRFCFDQFVFPQLTLIWGKQQEMMNWLTKLSGQAHFSWVTEWVWNWWFQLFCTFKPSSSWKFSIIVTDLSTTTEKKFFSFAVELFVALFVGKHCVFLTLLRVDIFLDHQGFTLGFVVRTTPQHIFVVVSKATNQHIEGCTDQGA